MNATPHREQTLAKSWARDLPGGASTCNMTGVTSASAGQPTAPSATPPRTPRRGVAGIGATAAPGDDADRPTPAQQWVGRVLPPRGADLPPWLVGVIIVIATTVGGLYAAARYGGTP